MGRIRDDAADEYYTNDDATKERERVIKLINEDLKTKSIGEVLYDLVKDRGYRYR